MATVLVLHIRCTHDLLEACKVTFRLFYVVNCLALQKRPHSGAKRLYINQHLNSYNIINISQSLDFFMVNNITDLKNKFD